MTWHLSRVEAAFGAPRHIDPADVPSAAWIDISDRVADWNDARGRSNELGEIVAVDGSITLDNLDEAFSPDYNPDALNRIDAARSTGGSSKAGLATPDGVALNSGLTNVALTVQPAADTAFMYLFGLDVNVTAGFAGTPILHLGRSTDVPGTSFDPHDYPLRVDPAVTYRFRMQHKLVSGTGQALKYRVYWLDSNGAVLSFTDSSTFTPTGTVTQTNLTGLTPPAAARYAVPALMWNAALAATQRVRVTGLQFGAYTSNVMPNMGYWPNVKPGVPLRIKTQDSGLTYRAMFYGHAGKWSQDANNLEATVDLLDGFEVLAGQELTTASDEATNLVNALVSVPLSDPSETRKNFVATSPVDPNVKIGRTVWAAPTAAQLSEYTFGDAGPQDGLASVYLNPESEEIGYCPLVSPPNGYGLFDDAGGVASNDWWVALWVRIKRKEHDARTHYLFTQQHRASTNDTVDIIMTGTGTVYGHINGTGGGDYVTPITTEKFYDGEWHLYYLEFSDQGANNRLRLRIDPGSAEEVTVDETSVPGSFAWRAGPYDYAIGGYPDPGTITFRNFARGYFSQARWGRGVLTDAQQETLYRAAAPPATTEGETEVDRIGRLLDFAGWPSTLRNLDDPVATLNGPYPSGTNALDAIKQTAEAAGGQVWIGKSGNFRYSNRRTRYNPTTVLTCSTALGTMPEDDITPTKDYDDVYNRIEVVRATGDPIVVVDQASIDEHGVRTLTLDMPLITDDEALQAGYWHLHLYAQPQVRIGQLRFAASASSGETLWDYCVNADLMDNEAVALTALQLGGHIYLVERIQITYDAGENTFEGVFDVSPGDAYANICVFDSSTFDDCILGW